MGTTDPVYATMIELLRGLSPAQRLIRALALSAFVRDLAWAGARRVAGDRGADAVTERFLMQVYGPEVTSQVARARKTQHA
jgi:hypothetical protein